MEEINLKPGDILVANKRTLDLFPIWKDYEFELIFEEPKTKILNTKVVKLPLKDTYHKIGSRCRWSSGFLELKKESKICKCPIEIIMLSGCKCGGE